MVKRQTKTKKKKKKKASTKRMSKKQKSGFFRQIFGGLIKWGFVLGLWGGIAIAALFAWYASELPDITEAMIFERRPTITVKAADGTILDRYGDVKGESLTVDDLPPHLIHAVLATEDRRFYSHYGVDPVGIIRAFSVNLLRGRFAQGGSTITQQLAKNLFLSRERTLKRKIQEAMLAIWLEQKLTKDEILSAYLNRVYMGGGAYGVDAAARIYFNKSAKTLSLRESAILAGLLKAPSRYSPAANPGQSAQRTNIVLNAMVEAGFLKPEDIQNITKLPPAPRRKPSSGETIRYFTDYIVGQLPDLIGPVEEDLIIQTTLDKDIQQKAEEAITKALLRDGKKRHIEQGAAVVLRLDGAVVAMVGGRDYGQSEFNRATHALRAPGSSFKPFVYLTALENGWKIDDVIMDEPITTGRYRPKNYGGKYYGEVTLYEALTLSLNTVAINLMKDVGPGAVIDVAHRLGIQAKLQPDRSLALGSSGVPVIEMAAAYAALGRGGLAAPIFSITKITDQAGEVYYERPRHVRAQQVVSKSNVKDLTFMMQSVIQNGTGRGAAIPYNAAGKTGTSQDFRDAWFCGFTEKYAAAVWVGNDDNSPTRHVSGGSTPARIWRDIMMKAMTKGGRAYGTFSGPSLSEMSFHDMIGRLLGRESDKNPSGFFNFGNFNFNKKHKNKGKEYSPNGRHQWQFNE